MKRWLIRSFFLGLLLFCVGAWARSYFYGDNIAYQFHDNGALGCVISNGELEMIWMKDHRAYEGFDFYNYPDPPNQYFRNWSNVHYFIGFFIRKSQATYFGMEQYVGIPFWFLTLLFMVIACVVWRCARPIPNPATSFPVPMDKMDKLKS